MIKKNNPPPPTNHRCLHDIVRKTTLHKYCPAAIETTFSTEIFNFPTTNQDKVIVKGTQSKITSY